MYVIRINTKSATFSWLTSWDKGVDDEVVGGGLNMVVDDGRSLFGEEKVLLVDSETGQSWGNNNVVVGSVDFGGQVSLDVL